MKIESQAVENRQVQLTVEVPADRVRAAMHTAARRMSGGTHIPGFRPGKAPYDVVVRRLGEEAIFDEALEALGQEAYQSALEAEKLDPVRPGSLEEIVSRDPLVLRYLVPLAPEVEPGAYRDVRIAFKLAEVSDEALNAAMEELRESQALIELANRPAQLGDLVMLDVKAELKEPEEGEAPALLDNRGVTILLSEQGDYPFSGSAQYLIGMEQGQEKSVEHTFPADYPNESLRGRRAQFHLRCHEVKSRILPEWSDNLARNFGEAESLLDLRIKTRKELQERAQKRADEEYADAVLDQILEGATIHYPPALVKEKVEDVIRELAQRLALDKLSLEDYLKIENKTLEDLRSDLRPSAEKRLRRSLVLSKLVELEGLQVDENEVEDEANRLSSFFDQKSQSVREWFLEPRGRQRLTVDLLTAKARDRLVAIGRGDAPDLAAEPSVSTDGIRRAVPGGTAAEPDIVVSGSPAESSPTTQ